MFVNYSIRFKVGFHILSLNVTQIETVPGTGLPNKLQVCIRFACKKSEAFNPQDDEEENKV